ncbi:MAG: NADH:flavin oxidoreductase [Novosphingobium sp.]
MDTSPLFTPFRYGPLELANRIVMAPMTRCFSPGGVPGPDVAAYYARRVEGGVGLVITEGTWVPHPLAANEDNAPRFHGEDALAGWRGVVDAVHAVGGRIMPQLWHVGLVEKPKIDNLYEGNADTGTPAASSPSGIIKPGQYGGEGATESEIADLIEAYAGAAANARDLGFDGVEVHGAHGYLIDQFFWSETNDRTDRWGGSAAARARFGAEVVRAMRARVGPDFVIVFRFSQWKQQDYKARLAASPDELAAYLAPLSDAGVDVFHASQRRFWESEFGGSDLNLAGWARKLTGRPAITVGSIGLGAEMLATMFATEVADVDLGGLERLVAMVRDGEVDLAAVGRGLIADPDWPRKVAAGRLGELRPYERAALASLV